jgi:hypothetical protein
MSVADDGPAAEGDAAVRQDLRVAYWNFRNKVLVPVT